MCMSNKEWIMWFEKAHNQRLYMYNIKDDKLYSINKNNNMKIYSFFMKDNELFINADTPNYKLFKVNLDTMKILGYESTAQENLSRFSSFFKSRSDELIYISTENETGKKILIIK